MKCIKCEKEIDSQFKVCPYCGTEVLEDGVLCKFCEAVNHKDHIYCNECGRRVDGRLICDNCKTIVERDYAYCPNCASPITTNKTIKTVKKQVKVEKTEQTVEANKRFKSVSFYKYLVLTTLSLLMFIFSFLNIFSMKIDMSEMLGEKVPTVSVKYSAFDALSGALADENYSYKDFELDYQEELLDIYRKYDNYEDWEIEYEGYAEILMEQEIMNRTNVFKYLKATNNAGSIITSSAVASFISDQAILNSVIGLCLIVATLGLLVLSSYKLIRFSVKGKETKFSLPIFELFVVVLFLVNAKMSFNVYFDFVNGGLFVTTMILAIAYTLTNVIHNIVLQINNKEAKAINLLAIPKMILCIVALVLCFSSTISLVYRGEDHYQKASYTNRELYSFYVANSKGEDIYSEKYTVSEFNSLMMEGVDEYETPGLVKLIGNPVILTSDIKNVETNIDVTFILSIVTEIVLVVAIAYYLFAITDLKGSKNKYISLLVVFTLSLTVMLANILSAVNLLDYVREVKLTCVGKVLVGAGSIVSFGLITVCLITEIVEQGIARKKLAETK